MLDAMQNPLPAMARAIAAIFAPQPPLSPSEWAEANLIVPDGPNAGKPWSFDLTPYVKEPLDFIGPDSPHNEIAVMKGIQTGYTTALIAAIGHSIDRDPCNMMLMQPTSDALSDFNRTKLQIALETSPVLRGKVASQTSRSSTGSTTCSKQYPGGILTLAIASSAADLRSKTIKKLFRDEIDEYPDDLDGQGDPLKLSEGRLTSFLKQGDWKKIDISTPTIKGASKIEERYEAGDKRRWFIPCPHCTKEDGRPSEFVFEFGPNFAYARTFPHDAHYVAPCCGSIIDERQRTRMVKAGRWIATDPRPGAFPSYHFDTLSSPFVPWDHIAKLAIEAEDNPTKAKSFHNLWLGLPFEVKGDAPDHVRLMERRDENLLRGRIPPRGLMLVAAADVQMRGIWVEVLAIAPDRQTYVVDALYLDGSTESPGTDQGLAGRRESETLKQLPLEGILERATNAFDKLRAMVLDRDFPDAFGRTRKIDALAVDAGYRSHIVYAWVRANQRLHPDSGQDVVLAVDGRDGWGRPAIGTPSLVDIDLAGHRVKKGCKLWPIGTYPLKGGFYDDLRKEGVKSGRERDPEGYCHFGSWLDEVYFKQITAEYLADESFKGRKRKVWKTRPAQPDNHLLDARVYNLALAEYLGLSATTEAEWALLARRRGLPEDAIATDLFAPRKDEAGAPVPFRPSPLEEDDEDPFAALARLNAGG